MNELNPLHLLLVVLAGAAALAALAHLLHRAKPPATPTVEEAAAQQLDKARRDLLEHHALAEYHGAMVSMLSARITRLEAPSHE